VTRVDLHPQLDKFIFSPCMEIGWRLGKMYWHKGLAREAAQACLDYAFEVLALNEAVAFTSALNTPSVCLMQRLGMEKTGEFAHPGLPLSHRLSLHVLYRMQRA